MFTSGAVLGFCLSLGRRQLGFDLAGALFAVVVLGIYFLGPGSWIWDTSVAFSGVFVGALLGRLFGCVLGTQGTI